MVNAIRLKHDTARLMPYLWSGPFLIQSRSKMYVNKKRKNARKKRQKAKVRRKRLEEHWKMGTVLAPPRWRAQKFFNRPDNEANPFNIPDILSQVSVAEPYKLLYDEPPEMKKLPDDFFGGTIPEMLSSRDVEGLLSETDSSHFEAAKSSEDGSVDFKKDWEEFLKTEFKDDNAEGKMMQELFGGGGSEMSEKHHSGIQDDSNSDYKSFLNEATGVSNEFQSSNESSDPSNDDQVSEDMDDFDSLFEDFEKEMNKHQPNDENDKS